MQISFFHLPNVEDQRREWLAPSVLLGARSVTAALVLCIAWLGSVVFIIELLESIICVGSILFQADG